MAAEPADPLRAAERDVARRRQAGETIVFTNGCFDLLHPGHVDSLRAAAELGDFLVVGINSDASVRGLKGAGRPVVKLEERAELVRAVRWVDRVVPFDEPTPVRLLEALRPDVMVKGADWRDRELPERELVESWGGRVAFVELLPGHSTTALIERIRALPSEADSDPSS